MILSIGKFTDLTPYFNFLNEMARNGYNAPHNDGFGYAIYNKGEVTVKKSIKEISPEEDLFGTTIIAHARKISSSSKSINNTQPFVNGMISFTHNGTIKELEGKNRSDSYFYFKKILKSFPSAIENIRQMNFTSINFIITDGNYAAAYREVREDKGYYSLFYKLDEDRFTVSTEVMDGKWYEIENQTLVVYRDGKIKEYNSKDVVPSVI
jgi:predicted glutamine amidotransferase